jgi:PAS domain S-box-containing protein
MRFPQRSNLPYTPAMPRTVNHNPINWYAVMPVVAMVAFAALMGALFWYLQRSEVEQQRQQLYRDVEWAQQNTALRWRDNQDLAVANSLNWTQVTDGANEEGSLMQTLLRANPDIMHIYSLDIDRQVQWLITNSQYPTPASRPVGRVIEESSTYFAFSEARDSGNAYYSAPFLADQNEPVVEMHVPVLRERAFIGTLVVAYNLKRTLVAAVSPPMLQNYKLDLADQGGSVLVSTTTRSTYDGNMSYELPLTPPGHGVKLRAFTLGSRAVLLDRLLLSTVAGLTVLISAGLGVLWYFARKRLSAEAERDRLFKLSLDVLAIMNGDGRFERVNQAFESLLGSKDAAPRLLDVVAAEDQTRASEFLRQVATVPVDLKDGLQRHSIELRCTAPGATEFYWLNWSITVVRGRGANGTLTLYGVAHDVTERKKTEQALASETTFRRAMEDSISTGMRVADMKGKITYVNRAFCDMVGLTESDLVGQMPPYPYWPKDQLDLHYADLRELLSGQIPAAGLRTELQRKDGTRFFSRMYVSPFLNEHGEQTGWMTSMTDITEPERIREQLRAAHEQFTTVMEQLDAAVCVFRDDSLLFTNKVFRQWFAEQPKALVLDRIKQLSSQAESDVAFEVGPRWFEMRCRHIQWVDQASAILTVATDITAKRDTETMQREHQERVARTSRLITMGEMASSLAHELNQPLTAIANYTMGGAAKLQSAARSQLPIPTKEIVDMLEKTARQAERAGTVVRRIREFVKRSEPDRRHCTAASIVEDAVGLAELDALRLHMQIRVHVAENLPILNVDPILIEQVLLNLIKNGMESMRGTPFFELHVMVRATENQVEFSVHDRGHGVSPESADKLYEPFFTTKAEGMGMGLNICRSIVEFHRGRLWFGPNHPTGTVFYLSLPTSSENLHEPNLSESTAYNTSTASSHY